MGGQPDAEVRRQTDGHGQGRRGALGRCQGERGCHEQRREKSNRELQAPLIGRIALESLGSHGDEFEDVEEHAKLTVDARGMRRDYLQTLGEFQDFYRRECAKANVDYVPMETSVSFDKALLEYLLQRQKRF